MENSNKTPYYISVFGMCLIGFAGVIVDIIKERFGTYPSYSSGASYSNMEVLGVLIPLVTLIIPIFAKKYRESLWSKKNISICLVTLIISAVLITITYANKDYYQSLWTEGHWERSDAPPIRWDVWNIIPSIIDKYRWVNHI